ncbi:hypothetical protein SRRS_34510 [Sporomusa rhizae]|uniref:WG repeat-containing protein n=1 Tax=Sporomusa rhizae TaxID=357999 RepID=UPI00352A9B18
MGKGSKLLFVLIMILIGTVSIVSAEEVKVSQAYDKVHAFSDDGYAVVEKDKKWGIIDKNGQEIVAPSCGYISKIAKDLFVNGFVALRRDGKCGYIDQTGKMVIELP